MENKRIGRVSYLARLNIALLIFSLTTIAVSYLSTSFISKDYPVFLFTLVIILPIQILLVLCFVKVVIPRLHDLNFSGWWFLTIAISQLLIILIGVEPAIFLILLFSCYLLVFKGTSGENQYGTPPEQPQLWEKIIAVLPPILLILFFATLFLLLKDSHLFG